jgi:hypothetical protein
MAKKKKAAVRRVMPPTSGEAEVTCTDAELMASGAVIAGGEMAAELCEVVNTAVHRVISEFFNPSSIQNTGEARGARTGWDYARRLLEAVDFADMPFIRVIGRVFDILLNHRGFSACTGGDVFRVFLTEIPDQLEENHRQRPHSGQDVDVTESSGRRHLNNRLQRLLRRELIEPTATRGGRNEDFILTEDGQNIFDGWPPLSDIPGLTLDGPDRSTSRPQQRS